MWVTSRDELEHAVSHNAKENANSSAPGDLLRGMICEVQPGLTISTKQNDQARTREPLPRIAHDPRPSNKASVHDQPEQKIENRVAARDESVSEVQMQHEERRKIRHVLAMG